MGDLILTFETVRELAIYETYSNAVGAYKTALADTASTGDSKATLLAAVVAAYPAFLKVLKFKVPELHKGFVFLNKFIAFEGLSTDGLKDISTQLKLYTAATTIADGKTSHDALIVYLENSAFFVQEFGREGGFDTTAFTASENDDLSRVAQVTAAAEIDDGGVSIFTPVAEVV